MKLLNYCVCACFTLLLGNSCNLSQKEIANELAVCGDDKLLIIDTEKSTADSVHVVWRWKVADAASQLPERYQRLMNTLDECKLYDNNQKILVTASSGGVVLLDRVTSKCLFYARVPMAHSAELLPNNRVVVALSTASDGNSIEVYDLNRPEEVLYRDSLYSGHGSVWMEKQSLLYVLGYDVLRAYSLKNWETDKPALQLEKSWTIPVESGHDLTPISDNELLVSGHEGVYCFNTATETYAPFEPLHNVPNVKSVNYDKKSGRLIYTKAEISWWTHHIYSLNPEKTFTIDDINLYKVRTAQR